MSTQGDLPDHVDTRLFSPLERILLLANGNVERIMSSYHQLRVGVHIRSRDASYPADHP